ncbi:MAG: trypsin-like serine protease [Myxococcota bacterium]|nr:trypsin-like serine protease [Myxococcota bacterium]
MKWCLIIVLSILESICTYSVADHLHNVQSIYKQSIYNGKQVEDGKWESVVAIRAAGVNCSGTLISSKFVLTAAHCLTDVFDINEIVVFYGNEVNNNVEIAVDFYEIHPNFCGFSDCGDDAHDFAYLRLAEEVCIEEPFPKLLFGDDQIQNHIHVGGTVTAIGFGLRSNDEIYSGGTKRKADLKISSVTELKKQFVAGGMDGDTCSGDSGGPAFIQEGDKGWRLAGVLSAGVNEICGSGSYYGGVWEVEPWLLSRTDYDPFSVSEELQPCQPMVDYTFSGGCRVGADSAHVDNNCFIKRILTLLKPLFIF